MALDQDTLERYRRILSYDHPYTLASANNLAVDLRALGRLDEALAMDRDILERRRQILGDDHPETLRSAKNLARDLRALGRVDEAEAIEASSGNTR